MARFDVYRLRSSDDYLLDCQADILSDLGTRFVAPLLPAAGKPKADRLNPHFQVGGMTVVMATQLASAVPVRDLGQRIDSLADHHATIMNAFDMLLAGY